MRKLLNHPDAAVKEMVEGVLLAHGDYLCALPGHPRALVRASLGSDKVGIVIGGGSGHEPAFLGYVGRGMADGVALGNIFAAPAPGPIVEAARAVHRGKGVLLIYGNYSGDIMNFEMAAELLQMEGIAVRGVVVNDDIASASKEEREKRRGIAGEIMVYKLAGAAAELGMSLDETAAIAQKAVDNTMSMGAAWSPCSLPQTGRPSFVLNEDEMEIGLGVHGEPGVKKVGMLSADDLAKEMVAAFAQENSGSFGDIAVLVNGLGSTSMMELHILYRALHKELTSVGALIRKAFVGEFITSLEMGGCSITVIHLDEELLQLLREPCDALGWTQCAR